MITRVYGPDARQSLLKPRRLDEFVADCGQGPCRLCVVFLLLAMKMFNQDTLDFSLRLWGPQNGRMHCRHQ